MSAYSLETIATALFFCAVVHTFSIKFFQRLAARYPEGSVGENFFHLAGEVEIVFGLWAGVLVATVIALQGSPAAIRYLESLNFTEPMFVFVVMAMAATRPILQLAERAIRQASNVIPVPRDAAFVFAALTIGPLLGSFITEPAAMTVTALVLKDALFVRKIPSDYKYAALAVLFVNVSIGGVLTPFAAPPVLMVAGAWGWDFSFMLTHFGWKAAIAVFVNAGALAAFLAKPLAQAPKLATSRRAARAPFLLTFIHLVFLAGVVLTAHHPVFFVGLFLFFVGLVEITKEYQDEIKLKESLLVAFFLAGLVVLGGKQSWWLAPLLARLTELPLYLGATGLTALVDNAALTYLGTQVPSLSESLKYALVAGAVSGGGLTVIANAPNPAGFSILQSTFGKEGVSPLRLLIAAVVPTLVAMTCLWLFPY